MIRRPPIATRTYPRFPYTTLVRSERWCGAGLCPDAFWRQTARSYQSAMRGAAIRARIDGEKEIALAHTIAAFSRAKKLERLDHYLRPRGRSKATMLDRLKAKSERTRKQ